MLPDHGRYDAGYRPGSECFRGDRLQSMRNKGEISHATRQRVLRRAKTLNYQTNWIARSLVTRRTFTIGLAAAGFYPSFFCGNRQSGR